MSTKIVSLAVIAILLWQSCKKKPLPSPSQPPPGTEMVYTNLNDREVKYQQGVVLLDVNKDNKIDLLFATQLIGDPLHAVDKRQYYVASGIYTALPVNSHEQIVPINTKEIIPLENYNGNNWYVVSEIVLMERREFVNGSITWLGNWLEKEKKYLPFQVLQNNQRYNGWIELTADKNSERLILHRMAVSKEAEKEVRAGL